MRKVYLAGPDVFAPDAIELGSRKKVICAEYGLVGVFPTDVVRLDPTMPKPEQGMLVYEALERVMRDCDAAIVNITPFHGPSMDVGSAFELGFMRALGRPVFAYSNSGTSFHDRAIAFWSGKARQRLDGAWEGGDGMEIDRLGSADNLMIDGCIRRSTGVLVASAVADADIYSALVNFERCIQEAAEWFGARGSPA